MARSGIGIGSTSLVLIFTVLCLAIFALISHTAAESDMAMAQAEAALVLGYYQADALAEQIAAGLREAETIPARLEGVEIVTEWDETRMAQIASFACPITERKELLVRIAITAYGQGAYEILTWQMRDTYEWVPDTRQPVWDGIQH